MTSKDVLTFLAYLGVFGFVVWLISLIDMPDKLRQVIIGIAVVAVILWALTFFGVIDTPIRLR